MRPGHILLNLTGHFIAMKTGVLVALLVIVAVLAGYFVFAKPAYSMTEEDAKKFFLEDLREKYPSADVREIMEITPLTGSDGSSYYQLKARVTNGMSTPCPERMHVYYDYPPKNFVAQPPEYITRGCEICINEPVCIIAFPEEAIIASHTYGGTGDVEAYIRNNAGATATAQPMEQYGNYQNVWVVRWRAPGAASGFDTVLSKSENKVLQIIPGAT